MSKKTTLREYRQVFSDNLRILIGEKGVSAVCREIPINRTQFNRYLSGDNSPNPDVLVRICTYFKVDIRILTTSLAEIEASFSQVVHIKLLKWHNDQQPSVRCPDIAVDQFGGFYSRWFQDGVEYFQHSSDSVVHQGAAQEDYNQRMRSAIWIAVGDN